MRQAQRGGIELAMRFNGLSTLLLLLRLNHAPIHCHSQNVFLASKDRARSLGLNLQHNNVPKIATPEFFWFFFEL